MPTRTCKIQFFYLTLAGQGQQSNFGTGTDAGRENGFAQPTFTYRYWEPSLYNPLSCFNIKRLGDQPSTESCIVESKWFFCSSLDRNPSWHDNSDILILNYSI